LLETLCMPVPATPEDLVEHDDAYLIKPDGTRFRVAATQVRRVLSDRYAVKKELDATEQKLRAMVEARSISAEEFEAQVRDIAPEMADFFDKLQEAGGLTIRLNAVGLMLAHHVMRAINPGAAEVLGARFKDDDEDNAADA
jgi:hypothetical protein